MLNVENYLIGFLLIIIVLYGLFDMSLDITGIDESIDDIYAQCRGNLKMISYNQNNLRLVIGCDDV